MTVKDTIIISDIEVSCLIGVSDEERMEPQRLLISLELEGDFKRASANDDIGHTIDYHAVYLRVREVCLARERKLIETLAEDIALNILSRFDTQCVRVKIKKFILPSTGYSAVKIERYAGS